MIDTVVEFRHVTKKFRSRQGLLGGRVEATALRGVSLSVGEGEILALVGESGAGKSTAGRVALGLERPDDGQVLFEGSDLTTLGARQRRALRRRTHFILQDPYQSLHPAMTVGRLVTEPLAIADVPRRRRRERVEQALEEVRLTPAAEFLARYPHQLSGGQRQRVAFARALVGEPRLVVADEPVSMLDVSLQAGILELIERMRAGRAIIFVTHDLAVARHVADRIAVIYAGSLVELGNAEDVVDGPLHPYTGALLAAAEQLAAPPEDPGPFPPGGQPCQLYGRCDPGRPECVDAEPTLVETRRAHHCAWHVADGGGSDHEQGD
ncbi:MAG TPA: ABC transporter ATP-binding protein [Egibacteraceae bacterium]|nr:ABC transporter ATP-binding protein [Egibacteraceae bacterium]